MVHMKGHRMTESLAVSFPLHGQGATEYLVLLAVVLIIALASIALLGFFPGMASDARITQSTSYWRGEARPFAILEHTITGATGNATIILQNKDALGTSIITNLSVGNGTNTTSTTFAPGESRAINIRYGPTGTAGTIYDLSVNITYTTPGGVLTKQFGAKNLVGKYV
jgi:hypothetical protein